MVKYVGDLTHASRRRGLIPTAGKYFPARSPWTDPNKRIVDSGLFSEFRRQVLSQDRTLDRLIERSAYTPVADTRVNLELVRRTTEAIVEDLSEEPVAGLVPSPAEIDPELAQILESGGADLSPADHHERVSALTSRNLSKILVNQTTVKRSAAAHLLGISLERIEQLARNGALIVTSEGVPRFQFTDDYSKLVPHLTEVLPLLPSDMDAAAVEEWFTAVSEDFWLEDGPTSARLWLCAGQPVEPVLAAAKSALIS